MSNSSREPCLPLPVCPGTSTLSVHKSSENCCCSRAVHYHLFHNQLRRSGKIKISDATRPSSGVSIVSGLPTAPGTLLGRAFAQTCLYFCDCLQAAGAWHSGEMGNPTRAALLSQWAGGEGVESSPQEKPGSPAR